MIVSVKRNVNVYLEKDSNMCGKQESLTKKNAIRGINYNNMLKKMFQFLLQLSHIIKKSVPYPCVINK